VTVLVISAGTEGVNSILKFLGYAKEDKKAQAAGKVAETPAAAVQAINPGPTPSSQRAVQAGDAGRADASPAPLPGAVLAHGAVNLTPKVWTSPDCRRSFVSRNMWHALSKGFLVVM
jgi:hypothetical protein